MIYRRLSIASILILILLSVANIIVLSSRRMQVGTPVCQIYNEQSGRRCARLYCDATGFTLSSSDICYADNGSITRPSEQYDLICEPTGNCRVTVPIICNSGNRSAEYEKGVRWTKRNSDFKVYLLSFILHLFSSTRAKTM